MLSLGLEPVAPRYSEQDFARRFGEQMWNRDADTCCHTRKVEPMNRLKTGKRAWISGLRREQGGARSSVQAVTLDNMGIARIHPLAAVTREFIDAELARLGLPQHPLAALGYRSVGCQLCTAPAAQGEGERDGRWAGSTETECGLHAFLRTRSAWENWLRR